MATKKAEVIAMIERMVDDVTLEEIIEAIEVRMQIEEGLLEIEAGRTIPHEEVIRRHSKWLK